MAATFIKELVIQSLPDDMDISELAVYGKVEWWNSNDYLACVYALRKCSRINWDAYIENYPDVKNSRIDPVLHFMKYGIYEGRKLKSRHPFHKFSQPISCPSPKVSVIVPSYNNSVFLEKCIRCLTEQTLHDIEIIVVDDASQDNSLDILVRLERQDPRIKLISFKTNQSQHMARKAGVAAATGDYVMFLDADDTYVKNACETAWRAIVKGYDIVCFNINIINLIHLTDKEEKQAADFFNAAPNKEYPGKDLLRLIFVDNILKHTLDDKIFDRHLIQYAFTMLEDGYFRPSEDLYAMLPIAHAARNLLKIDISLYNYTRGMGGSAYDGSDDRTVAMMRTSTMLNPIKRYCEQHDLRKYYEAIKLLLFRLAVGVLPNMGKSWATKYLNALAENYGVVFTVTRIALLYDGRWDFISTLLQQYKPACRSSRNSKKIGIFYFRLSPGGVETTIQNICRLLVPLGYKIYLFLEKKSEFDLEVDAKVKKYYLPTSLDKKYVREHLEALYNALLHSNIGTMIYMYVHNQSLLWDTMLMRLLDIQVIGAIRLDATVEFLTRGRVYNNTNFLQTMRALDKLMCLNTSSELYLRSQGVDAIYIPNTIRNFGMVPNNVQKNNSIVVLGRISDKIKQVGECLKVFSHVIKTLPSARMVFVSDFDSEDTRNKFLERARVLKVEDRIEVTGWTNNPAPVLDKCKVLFSASYLEGFPNGIAEAQLRGLPVVMYDLDIALAEDNPSIVRVPQDDAVGAADAIVELLNNSDEWRRLSTIAMNKAAQFTDARFATSLVNVVENCTRLSPLRFYSLPEYQRALKYMTYYAGRLEPTYCK